MGLPMSSLSRLLRVGMWVMEENFASMMMMLLSMALTSLCWCKPPRVCLHPHNPQPLRLLCTGLPILPYRSWCRWCVSAKRRNAPHLRLPDHSREIPLLVADYCFVRDSRDDDLLTVFVGRLYPSRAIVAIPCDVRGVDDYAVGRLAQFLRDCGVKRLVHMSDQERSLGAMITSAMDALSGSLTWAGAVRENSAVGESQSNGKAEAAVQAVEDQIRVMKAALESRLSARIPSQHPVMKWMVEYAAVILNKYAVQPSGRTAYHDLHGKRVSERLVEFGETVLHFVPKKHRHKLDMRWGIGVFLGTTMSTNEKLHWAEQWDRDPMSSHQPCPPGQEMEPRS